MRSTILLVIICSILRSVYCWHYVPMCPADSYYNGSLAVTNSGRLCQRWVDKTPHDHSWDYGTHHRYDEDYYYDTYHYFEVDGTVEAAENFCRNIGFDFVWCLTTDPGARDEYCDVRLCTDPDPECQAEANLTHYAGNVSVTDGFRTCQRWSDQAPHAHPFNSSEFFPLDLSVEDASNYCRNVGGDNLPWCFTTDETVRWQYCSEMICQVSEPQCGGVLTDPSGWVTSIDRNGDGLCDQNRDCIWTIIAPDGMVVDIYFHMVDFNRYTSVCDRNDGYIELIDDSQLDLICDEETESYQSRSSVLNVRINTLWSVDARGVNMSYSHVFPEQETSTSNYSTSPLSTGYSAAELSQTSCSTKGIVIISLLIQIYYIAYTIWFN